MEWKDLTINKLKTPQINQRLSDYGKKISKQTPLNFMVEYKKERIKLKAELKKVAQGLPRKTEVAKRFKELGVKQKKTRHYKLIELRYFYGNSQIAQFLHVKSNFPHPVCFKLYS